MLRFRLSGIPFEVAPYFWFMSAILGGNVAHGPNGGLLLVVWVACVFVSIIVHEMGHALTARRFGAEPSVRMYAFGGVTMMPGARFTRGQDLLVVLGGPAAGLALYMVVRGAIYFVATSAPDAVEFLDSGTTGGIVATQALSFLSFINWVWTLFNLLPILPLDGGLILRNLLGYGRENVARIIGMVCAAGCAVWMLLIGASYNAFFFGFLAFQNFRGGGPLPGSTGR